MVRFLAKERGNVVPRHQARCDFAQQRRVYWSVGRRSRRFAFPMRRNSLHTVRASSTIRGSTGSPWPLLAAFNTT
jgi:hypothetical protein